MADSDDEFGLASSDEEALTGLDATSSNSLKRKSEDELNNDNKRQAIDGSDLKLPAVATEVLKNRFHLPQFRMKQKEAIARLLNGGSAAVVFPTGGGKSLCYQLPALCFKELDRLSNVRQGHAEGGITLIVSPLIALMKDQGDALKRLGINAAVMDSTKTREEYLATVDAMRNGKLDILYCAPERLNNEGFVAAMANVQGGVRLLAVDEAHCISEWGHAFRPDYLKVARFAKEIQAERVVCLTATATPQVAKDICSAFDIPPAGLFKTTTYRSNLRLHAQAYQTKSESYPKLRAFLHAHPGPAIIYVTLQKHAEDLAEQLRKHKLKARHFHAGMKPEEKTRCQDEFMSSNEVIIVATIAFGMGIDKANIRNVIHYDIPRSLEGYSQEIGRAGRDGLESHCMLYLCAEDLHLRESFARGDLPSKASVRNLLNQIFSLPVQDGRVIEATIGHQSREFDIRPTVLNNIYAQLELRFGLLRATTPKYTSYSYKELGVLKTDSSPAAQAILAVSKKAKTWTSIDSDAAAHWGRLTRSEIVAKLNDWNDRRLIELKAAGVVNIYRVLKNLPSTAGEKNKIVDALYKELEVREQRELENMKQVMDLVTGSKCFGRALAEHFGDGLPEAREDCGHCTWCETRTAVKRVEPPKVDWNSNAFFRVLEACHDRDDPRFLARIAFGISSPRITQCKLNNSPVFGSMEDHDFMSLLRAFTKVCDKTGQ